MTTALLMQQARIAIREGRVVDARRLLRQIIHEDPTNHAAWLLLARATPDAKVASQYIDRARSLQPDSPLVQRAENDLLSGKTAAPKRRKLSWHLLLPLLGLAVIVGLLAGRVRGSLWQQLYSQQNGGVESVLAAANVTQEESLSSSPVRSGVASAVAAQEEANLGANSAPIDNMAGQIDGESGSAESGAALEIIYQPVVAAGSDAGLPAAIVQGLEISATAAAEEEAAVEELSAGPEREEAADDDESADATSIQAVIQESEQEEVSETAEVPSAAEMEAEAQDLVNTAAETALDDESQDYTAVQAAPGERWIDVNLTTQTLTAYEGDTPVLQSLISSGLWQFPTVTGNFRTWIKYDSQDMTGYHLGYNYELEDVPYVMYFFEDFAIHGAYWHNNFGTPMSHGCVNMNVIDAQWLYNWAPVGTLVSIHH